MRSAHASALLLAALLAACNRPPAAPTAPTAPAAQTSANSLRIVATDFAFAAPDTVPSGLTNIVMVNQGKELHQVVVTRIDSAKTPDEIKAGLMANPIPGWVSFPGGPNSAVPGDSANATAILTPGNYLLVCFDPSPDGKAHVEKGMIRSLVVKDAGTPMAMPAADVTITARDYAFEISPAITAGTHVVRLANVGPQMHEVTVFKLAPGKTMAQVSAWMQGGMKGAPPVIPIGGIAGVSTGVPSNFTATFTPGNYVLVCFVPDAKDGKPHVAHGMLLPFTVS